MRSTYEVFQGRNRPGATVGDWYWRLRAKNGEIVAQSEAYGNKHDAQEGAKTARRVSRTARIVEVE